MAKETSPNVSQATLRQRAAALRDFADRFDKIAIYMEKAQLLTIEVSASESWKRAAAALVAYITAAQRACDKHVLEDDCSEIQNPNHNVKTEAESLIVAENRNHYKKA